MKTITPSLQRFALTTTILTVVFRYFLSYGIESQNQLVMILSAILYGLSMFAAGWYFGVKDGEYLPIFDVGFRFHTTTYVIHNGISLLWIGLGFGSHYEKIDTPLMTTIYWGVFLFIHFLFYLWARKNSIDDLDKDEIFD